MIRIVILKTGCMWWRRAASEEDDKARSTTLALERNTDKHGATCLLSNFYLAFILSMFRSIDSSVPSLIHCFDLTAIDPPSANPDATPPPRGLTRHELHSSSTAHLAPPSAPFTRPGSPSGSTHSLTVNYLPSKFSHTPVSRAAATAPNKDRGWSPAAGALPPSVPTPPGLLLLTLAHAHRHAQGSCGGFNGISDSFTADGALEFKRSDVPFGRTEFFYNVSLSILRLRVLPFFSFAALLLSRTTGCVSACPPCPSSSFPSARPNSSPFRFTVHSLTLTFSLASILHLPFPYILDSRLIYLLPFPPSRPPSSIASYQKPYTYTHFCNSHSPPRPPTNHNGVSACSTTPRPSRPRRSAPRIKRRCKIMGSRI
jgi:hypothetical protein